MMKNNSIKIIDQSLLASKSVGRLIVLVPCLETDLTLITRRVWELAESTNSHIKFIGLCDDAIQEPGLRRTLVTLGAMLNYENVSAETEVVFGKDWLKAVKSCQKPGDMIVCFDEQRPGSLKSPLSQVLQSDWDVPIYIFSGSDTDVRSRSNWLAGVGTWIGFVVIILSFFVLQISIYRFATNWATPLALLSTLVEFGLIGIWHRVSVKP